MQKETHTFLSIDTKKETATAGFMQIIKVTKNSNVREPDNNARQMQTSRIALARSRCGRTNGREVLLVDFDRSVHKISNGLERIGWTWNLPVDPPHECIRCQKSNRPGQQTIDHAREKAVREEKNTAHKAGNVQLKDVIPNAVGENPDGACAANKERLPPPVIVLFIVSNCSLK